MKNVNWWSRKLHRWGALASALPMLLVIITGLLLQVKKEVSWIQPPTQKGQAPGMMPTVDWSGILAVAKSDPAVEIQEWSQIDRLDVQPSKGIVKVQIGNHELQIDLASGEVLSSTVRRSDLIESLHDGSFFADFAKLWIFLPNGILLLALWVTGAWLWYLPIKVKRKKSRKAKPSGEAH